MIDKITKAIKYGENLGASEVFIVGELLREKSFEILVGNVKSEQKTTGGLQVIVSVGKKHGSAYTTSLEEKDLFKAVEDAISIAKNSEEDPEWPGIPNATEQFERKEKVEEIPFEEIGKVVGDIFRSIAEEDRFLYIAGYTWVYEEKYVASSYGAEIIESNAGCGIFTEASVKTDKGTSPGIFNLKVSKTPIVDVSDFIDEIQFLLDKAKILIKAEDTELDMIMHPMATSGLLTYGFVPGIKGDSVHKKSSRFLNKVGEKIFSEKITIYDDPRNKDAISYSFYDFDGIPTRKTTIVDKGRLREFLWNYYWAKLAGTESTGNGFRAPRTGEYDIRAINLTIEPGKRPLSDIIGDISRGVYVMSFQGVHSTNPDSGMFSVMANPAFYIEDGEIKGCLLGAAITDNVDSVFSRVEEVSSTVMYNMTTTLPWVLVKNIRITSRI